MNESTNLLNGIARLDSNLDKLAYIEAGIRSSRQMLARQRRPLVNKELAELYYENHGKFHDYLMDMALGASEPHKSTYVSYMHDDITSPEIRDEFTFWYNHVRRVTA